MRHLAILSFLFLIGHASAQCDATLFIPDDNAGSGGCSTIPFGAVSGAPGKVARYQVLLTAEQLGGAATGIAFSFASTYALGHLAKRYYGGGRQMSGAMLKEEFQRLLPSARALQQDYVPQIRQKASSLDATQVMALVRGQGL